MGFITLGHPPRPANSGRSVRSTGKADDEPVASSPDGTRIGVSITGGGKYAGSSAGTYSANRATRGACSNVVGEAASPTAACVVTASTGVSFESATSSRVIVAEYF